MGMVGGLIGTAGGIAGTGFGGPKGATVVNPVKAGQVDAAYKGVKNSMAQQNDLLAALKGQNGLQNQSDVYNQQQGIVNGTGPNPAMAMLHNETAKNTANQAALMAGQRGSSQNAGMMARLAASQGATNQQNSIGQGAALQANQSLNALNNAGSMANTQAANQIGQTNANVGSQQAEQANLFNALNGVNANNTANQGNINNINGQLANTQMQGQAGMIGGMMSGASSMMKMGAGGGARGGMVPHYEEGGNVVTPQDTTPPTPNTVPETPNEAPPVQDTVQTQAPQATNPISTPQADFGNPTSQVQAGMAPAVSTPTFGSNAGAEALAKGMAGEKQGGGGGEGASSMMSMMADGGEVDMSSGYGGMSKFGSFLHSVQSGTAPTIEAVNFGSNSGAAALQQGVDKAIKSQTPKDKPKSTPGVPSDDETYKFMKNPQGQQPLQPGFARGGKVAALVSPGEKYLPPSSVNQVRQGANPMSVGQTIPGKPKVGGAKNSYTNDTVPANLDSGGIVLPRSVTQAKDAPKRAEAFVRAVLAKKGKGSR